jgi:hypothetical protein
MWSLAYAEQEGRRLEREGERAGYKRNSFALFK